MSELNEKLIAQALKGLIDLDDIAGISLKDGKVVLSIGVPDPNAAAEMEPTRARVEEKLKSLPGVVSARVILTAEKESPKQQQAGGYQSDVLLPQVKSIIAVASGKGGVGKSTTAINVALALKSLGLSVGLFDADIYGPSMPRMLGIAQAQPEATEDGEKINPLENYGIKCMSMGFLVPEDSPVIWRGPMVMGALEQMMKDVAWGELDVMVVDMPPGTGDTQLTMSQRVPLTGAVIVSTPQDIALLDARKGLNMFRKVDVPVLGIIENMSYYNCPQCGHEAHIFGHGGAQKEAARLSCDFLGEIPLDIRIRETSDGGEPIVVSDPKGAHALAYIAIAQKIWDKVTVLKGGKKMPKIGIQ